MTRTRILAATLFGALSLSLHAQQPGGGQGGAGAPNGPGGGPRRGPPPEAIEACNGKAAGTACSFTGREGRQVSGSCFSPPAHADAREAPPMACKPEHPTGSQHAPKDTKQ